MSNGVFEIQADINPIVDERKLRAQADKMAKDFQARLAKQLKPIEIKITAQQAGNVNRSLQAMEKNLKSVATEARKVNTEFNNIGKTATNAFRTASTAKDKFRANLRALQADLRRVAAEASTTGAALAAAFSKIAISNLAPVPLPVIPVITKSLAAIQPLPVPIIPIIPRVNIPPIEVPVKLTGIREQLEKELSKVKVTSSPTGSGQPIAKIIQGSMAKRAAEANKRVEDFLNPERGGIVFGEFIDSFKKIGQGAAKAAGGVAEFTKNLKSSIVESAKQSSLLKALTSNFGQLATAAAGYLSIATLIKGINLAADLEVLNVGLTNVLGSTEKAAQALELLRGIASRSGLPIEELTKVFQKFIAAGLSIPEAAAQVELIGRAAIASGGGVQEFSRAATAMIQIMSKGQLQYEEFRGQLAEAIPSLNVEKFAEKLGALLDPSLTTAQEKIAKGMEAIASGTTPANIAIQALNETFAESPGVMGAFETRAGTLRGTLDRLRTQGFIALQKASADFVKTLTGSLAGFDFSKIENILKNVFAGVAPILGAVAQAFVRALPLFEQLAILFKNLAPSVAAFLSILSNALAPLTQVVRLLNLVNPLLQVLLFRFLAMRTATVILEGLSFVVAALPARFAAAGTAATAFGARINALAGPVGVGVAAFLLLSNVIDRALGDRPTKEITKAIDEIVSATQQGISGQPLADKFVDDFIKGVESRKDVSDRFTKLVQVNPAAAKQIVDTLKSTNTQLFDEKGNLIDISGLYDTIVANQKKQNDELLKSLGVGEAIVQTEKDQAKAFQEKFKPIDDLIAGQRSITSALTAQAAAARSVQKAHEDLAKATKALKDLEADRERIIRDTISPLEELAAAERDVADIRAQLRDNTEDLAQTETDLAEAQDPQRLLEQRAALDRDIARAVIARDEAEKALNETIKQSNLTERQAFDIRGLTLDQIKGRLRTVRATLSAQKQAHNLAVTEKDVLEKKLDLEDASQQLTDAQRAKAKFETDHLITIRELEEHISDSLRDREGINAQAAEAQKALNLLKAGETTLSKELAGFEEQKAAAVERQRDASQGVRDAQQAERDAALVVTDAREKQATLVATIKGDETTINKLLFDRLGLLSQLDSSAFAVAKKTLVDTLPTLLGTARLVNPVTGETAAGPVLITPEIIADVQKKVLGSTGTDLRAILKAILRQIGLSIPGLKSGGLIDGAPGSFGTLIRAGEFNKSELLLPLTNASRSVDLLSRFAPTISLAAAKKAGPVLPASVSRSGPGSVLAGRQAQRKQNEELASAIARATVQEMVNAGVGGGNVNDVDINLGSSTNHEVLIAKAVAAEIKKQLGGY